MKANIVLLLCFGFLAACSSDRGSSGKSDGGQSVQSVAHSYQSTACFMNKGASAGMGQTVYTQATVNFHADSTGVVDFSLYSDAACANLLGQGSANNNYQITRSAGGVFVVQVDQEDSPGGSVSTYFLVLKPVSGGAYFHIDGNRSDAGPYSSAPSDADLAAFVADPAGVGIFFNQL